MFRATAPVRPAAPAADGTTGDAAGGRAHGPAGVPRLVRAGRYAPAGPGTPYVPAADRERFYRQLGDPHGVPFDRAGFAGAPRRTSVELARGALAELGPLTGEDGPELVVVAYAAPDFEHSQLVASCVQELLPGEPLAFALSDQGALAPFSALRTGVEYARRCGFRRLLVLAVDQSSQPFAVPAEHPGAVRADAAVALLFEWSGAAAPVRGMGQQPWPAPGPVAPWDAELPLVAGAGVRTAVPGVWPWATWAGPGQPATAVWSALAGLVGGGPARVVVADHDPERETLAHCTLDLGAPARRTSTGE
ncbi:hypothetical protein AB0F03_17540 [Streptomyces sp. NPDC028722]|uniref:hypothetical protein n=1 Tax=Streptomyces sp. NPDC028722 TaxID=3155016 RepID=UPI0033EAFE65